MNIIKKALQKLKSEEVPVAVSEHGGIRYLHFGSDAIQGCMKLDEPTKLELEYTRDMVAALLLVPNPKRVAVIGLGAGSLVKWVYTHWPRCKIVAVEVSDAVAQVARGFFELPRASSRFCLVMEDGGQFMESNEETFDLILVDVYDAEAKGPVLSSPEFYAACARSLAPTGVLSVNLFGKHRSYETNLRNIERAFSGRSMALPASPRGNVIALGLGAEVVVDPRAMRVLGRELQTQTGVGFVRYATLLKDCDV